MNLESIERRYPVESIYVGKHNIWPAIRLKVAESLRKQRGINPRTVNVNAGVLLTMIKSVFYNGFKFFLLKSSEYWVFSSSERRKYLDGKYHDRVIEDIPDILDKVVVVENPLPLGKHYNIDNIPNQNIVSQSVFYFGSYIFSFVLLFLKFRNHRLLIEILTEASVNMNYKKEVRRYIGDYYFIKFILRFFKPKCVFFVYSGSSMGMIRAFKEANVKVIEMQHGVINNHHMAYNVFKPFNRLLFPDFLFTYGESELQYFQAGNYFIPPSNVVPVGYSFLSKSSSETFDDAEYLAVLRNKYKTIVAVSLQEPYAHFLFDFLTETALLDDSVLYLIVPRSTEWTWSESYPENIMIERKMNVYQAISFADVHATINSTCATEAFTFGKPTILIDYDARASQYFGQTFFGLKSVKFVSDSSDFLEGISSLRLLESRNIKNEGRFLFKNDFKINFLKALNAAVRV